MLIDELTLACKRYVQTDLLEKIKLIIKKNIATNHTWSVELDTEDKDEQTILFNYPTAFTDSSTSYIQKRVKVEFGARGDPWPTVKKIILPYVEKAILGTIGFIPAETTVLQATRTYWEKATILHMLYYISKEKPRPSRMSRHYYDFYMLTKSKTHEDALSNLTLLKRVAIHKTIYFRSAWARYDLACPGTIKLTPPESRIKELKEDYIKMREMFFEEPPQFDDVLKRLKTVEAEISKNKNL